MTGDRRRRSDPTPSFADGLQVQRVLAAVEAQRRAQDRRRTCDRPPDCRRLDPGGAADDPTVTLFTGQWADLPFEEVCRLASEWGYDGLEIACWGDHLDVDRAAERRRLRRRSGCDLLEQARPAGLRDLQPPRRARRSATTRSTSGTAASCRDRIWGDGDPEGVRQRAAEEMKPTARAAAGSASTPSSASPARRSGRPWRCSRRCPSR